MSKFSQIANKAISFMLSCVLVSTSTAVLAAENDNLFDAADASCEVLDNFNTNTYQTMDREIDHTIYHSGDGSLKVTIPGTYQTYVGFKPTVDLVEGEEYTFSVWYYNPENITGRMFLRFTSVTGNSISNWVTGTAFDSGISMSSGDWVKYEFDFTATQKLATDLKYFYITTETGEGKAIYFDDASLKLKEKSKDDDDCVDPIVAACESDTALNTFSSVAVGTQAREIIADAHSGNGSVKVTVSSTNLSYISFRPTAKLVEGETYYFSVWYKDARPTTDGKIELRGRTASGPILMSETAQSFKSGDWVKYETPIKITSQMANDLTFFYVTSGDLKSMGDIYFDDISLKKVPEDETHCLTTDFGEIEAGAEMVAEFDNEIDGNALPTNAVIDGDTLVNISTSLLSDGKSISLVITSSLEVGEHSISFICKDMHGRDVEANATLTIVEEIKPSDNLVAADVAACESSAALNAFSNAAVGVQAREISTDAHNGKGSVKVNVSSTNLSYVSFRPTDKLVENKTYYFSVWYKDARPTTDGKIELRGRTASGAIMLSETAQSFKSGDWVKFEAPIKITSQMANDLTFFYVTSADIKSMGDIYFDDLNFRPIPEENISLVNTYPQSGDNNVKFDKDISLEFSGEVESADVDAKFYINNKEFGAENFVFKSSGNNLLIKQKNGIIPDAKYKIVINNINDVFGRSALSDYTIEFSTTDKLDFNVNFLNENGTKITKPQQGKIKAEFDIENNTGKDKNCIAVIMVCEGERVKKVYSTPMINIEADGQRKGTDSIVVDVPSNCYLKAFLWTNTTEDLRALSKCIELK